jgi:hypothetical protein
LIQTLSVKLDSAARYRLYEEDARKDGFDDSAELFGRLEQQEREATDELMRCRVITWPEHRMPPALPEAP